MSLSPERRRVLSEIVRRGLKLPTRAAATTKAVQPFEQWLREVSPTWTWHWPHLEYMRAQLARVTSGEVKFLMISCPPRHGKTEQNTVRYAAKRIEGDPSTRVIIGAYNQKLAEKFSRKVKRIVVARGVALDPSQQAVNDWATTAGGGVRAAGVGSGVTGTGADLIIIDDPVKSRAEAESEAYRQRCYEWYTDDIFSRREPGCAICLTMTRWHEKDLAGQILASEEAPSWTVINLPALAGPSDPLGRAEGEALCPDRFPVEELARIKRVMRQNFYALYQGSPTAPEGNKFKRGWFQYWEPADLPGYIRLNRSNGRSGSTLVRVADCRTLMTGDLAASTKTAADYSVFAVWLVTPHADLVLYDLWRDQVGEPEILKAASAMFARHRPAYVATGLAGLGLPIVQQMRRGDPRNGRPPIPVRAVEETKDKVQRAATAIVMTEAGQVYFPAPSADSPVPWLDAFERELLGFPGAHDDQVDTFSNAADDMFWSGSAAESEARREARDEADTLIAQDEAQADHDRRTLDDDRYWN